MPRHFRIPLCQTNAFAPRVVGTGDVLEGAASIASQVVRDETFTDALALVMSEDYDTLVLGEAHWEYEGAICKPTVRDFTIDGRAAIPAVPIMDAIRLFASAPRVMGMNIVDVPGYAIWIDSGSNPFTPPGGVNRGRYDGYEPLIHNNHITRVLEGIYLGTADFLAIGNVVDGCAGHGFWKASSGGHVVANHNYACDVGFRDDGPGGAEYVGCESESCRISFLNNTYGTRLVGFRSYLNTECAIDSGSNIKATDFAIDVPAGTTGIKLRQYAASCRLEGEIVIAGSGVGVEFTEVLGGPGAFTQDDSVLNLIVENGVAVKVSPGAAINNARWDITIKGTGAIQLFDFGTNNHCNIVGGTVVNSTGGDLDASNRIYHNGDRILEA